MYLDQMLPLAEKWKTDNNGQKAGYRRNGFKAKDFTLDNNGVE